jgi:hypothetical protein
MTYDQFHEIAKRNGFVRWFASNRIERLSVDSQGSIFATHLITMKIHRIAYVSNLSCREITVESTIKLGDLFV